MEAQLIKLNRIKVNDKNPRTITEDKLRRLVESILVFPKMLTIRPIVIDEKGVALGGNMRTRALKEIKKLGCDGLQPRLQEIRQFNNKPVEEQNEIIQHWEAWFKSDTVPIIYADTLTEEEKREFIIKDNSSFGAWDWDALANEWDAEELDDWGVGVWQPQQLDATTSSTDDVFNLPEELDGVDIDPDAHYETKVKAGEVWQLGEHRLMCGDSTDADAVAKLMNGERADLWLTDPPYNVDYSSKNAMLNKMDGGNRIETDIEHDKMSDADFDQFLRNAFGAAQSVMKEGASYYVWTAQGHALTDISKALDAIGMSFRQQLIWVKNNFVIGRSDYQLKHEPCFYGWKAGAAHNWHSDRSQTTILEFDKPQKSDLHPTMKPVPLFGYQIGNSTKEGDIVIDTFGGSGTTMIACEQLGRKCRMMELDEHYCDVIIARWEQFTGKQAVKIE